uniref:Deoxyribonuclease II n=1 Tax=Panagrolaimus superbus TaxID=310955 RepID=A0A914Y7J0_9BILA
MLNSAACIYFLALFALPIIIVSAKIGCKDQNNNDVDWYVGYKMPQINDNSIPGIGEGAAFYYMDVNMDSFVPSSNDLFGNQQAIAYTLQQYYDNKALKSDFSYVLYNDEEAVNDNDNDEDEARKILYGHTKGVVFFGKSGGFWLIHSLPKFPSPDAYVFATNAKKNGQSILCITFEYDELTKIGTQLYYNHPPIYASNLAPSMESENPDLAKVLSKQYKISSPFSSTLNLQSRGGQKFISFAKTANFSLDLYNSLVAPTLQVPLYVETWRQNSSNTIPLDCKAKYLVLDAITMKVGKTTEFKHTKDHSKLVISTNPNKPFICIGDINRMQSQYKRGGGAVCIELKKLWDNYWPMFLTHNSC